MGKGFESLRAAQTEHLLRIIQTEKQEKQERIILAGDFNAGLEEAGYGRVREAGLESAYRKVLGQEPEYTTRKIRKGEPGCEPTEKKATIDFIFSSSDTVSCSSVLCVPSMETLGPGLLPSPTFPSDHMSLAAKFVLL